MLCYYLGPGRLAVLERWLYDTVTILDSFPVCILYVNGVITCAVFDCIVLTSTFTSRFYLYQNVITPYPTATESTKTISLHSSHSGGDPKLKLSIDFKRPAHITKCG